MCFQLIQFRLPSLEQEWLRSLIQNSETIYPTLLITIIYLRRLRSYMITVPNIRNTDGPRFTFVTALKIASDYMLDNTYNTTTWAKLTQFPLKTINDGCLEFMKQIDFDFFVPTHVFFAFDNYIATLKYIKRMKPCRSHLRTLD